MNHPTTIIEGGFGIIDMGRGMQSVKNPASMLPRDVNTSLPSLSRWMLSHISVGRDTQCVVDLRPVRGLPLLLVDFIEK